MFRRRREARRWRNRQPAQDGTGAYFQGRMDPLEELDREEAAMAATAATRGAREPVVEVDDFLPPDFIAPSQQTAGMMMPWPGPLVADGEILTCPRCGTYRDWIVLNQQHTVWLRCRAGHETIQTRLDTAWFNRHSGPMEHHHATYEDGIRFLGH
ncbi:hypothetical protein [Streptomyces sp. NPDC088789]|uniref:hypothetical protein n=1 Tax=Streptomyces sp. NPDC088789 TaxID=3365899 RepID=UPI0038070FDD